MPDLNIIAAEYVGWGSRTDTGKSAHVKTILAGYDPVALDYIATREVLLPSTPQSERVNKRNSYRELNDPDNTEGPLYRFLHAAAQQGVGNCDLRKIAIHS